MTRAARLIAAFEERNIHVKLDGKRLVVDGPADIVTDDLVAELRARKQEIIRALRGWRVTYVTVEVAHGRLWLSTVERAYGIPLAPGERIAPAAVGAAIAWLFEAERKSVEPECQ
jgi:TubC N-terminal docking domain